MRVVIVMPPVTDIAHERLLDSWPTVVQQATALREHARLLVTVVGRTRLEPGQVHRDGVAYHFAGSDRQLVDQVRRLQPDVVHVHGLGFTRLTIRLGRAVHGTTTIVLQHHGEPPARGRTLIGHRIARRYVDGYLFTGALLGQVQPFIDCGMIDSRAPCYEVLEAASTLPTDESRVSAPPELIGAPTVLWVGRLIESKDPLAALAAFALAAGDALPAAHLHLLATDRSMEPQVRAAIALMGSLGERVHLHDPVTVTAMPAWYRSADIMLSTSWREGSGYSLIEAISEGCVPVATGIPSHRAIVGDLVSTFDPGDSVAAARLLVDASRIDAATVREFARKTLSWPVVAEQLATAYESARSVRSSAR